MKKSSRYLCGEGGFTLLELLISVAITALIMTAVVAAFSVAMSAWRISIDAGDGLHHADYIADQLVMGLRSAYYPDDFKKEGRHDGLYGLMVIDDGDGDNAHDSISWCKLGSSLVGANSGFAETPHRIEITVRDGDEEDPGGVVIRAWRLFGQDEDFDPEEDVTPIVIASQVVGFDCRVRDPMSPDDEIEWLTGDEWSDTNRIPPQVEFSLYIRSPREGDDPIEVKRIVEIPLSALSLMKHSPTESSTSTRSRSTSSGSGKKDRSSSSPAGDARGVRF